MLTLNLIHLIENKTIPIIYETTISSKYFKHKYNTNYCTPYIVELLIFLNSLSCAYLYIHKYSSLKQKILFTTNSRQYIYLLRAIAALTSNYSIDNVCPGIFSNWFLLRKKLILYKWLRYFFATNLASKNNYKNILYVYHTLYLLYLKLKLKYHGLKELTTIPDTLIIIN